MSTCYNEPNANTWSYAFMLHTVTSEAPTHVISCLHVPSTVMLQVYNMVSFLGDKLASLHPTFSDPVEYAILVWLPEVMFTAILVWARYLISTVYK